MHSISRRQRLRRALQLTLISPVAFDRFIRRMWKVLARLVTAIATLLAFPVLLRKDLADSIAIAGPRFLLWISIFLASAAVVTFMSTIVGFGLKFRESHPVERFNGELLVPSDSLATYLSRYGGSGPAIGGALEIFAFPFLDKNISNNGWDPRSVKIIREGRTVDPPKGISPKFVTGENSPKYALIHVDGISSDSVFRAKNESLILGVAQTDWATLLATREVLSNEDVRHQLVSANPSGTNPLPNSLSLHLLCLLNDKEILVLRRDASMSYFPGSFSFSMEEQLSDLDGVGADGCCEAWFRRSLCEEVFPLLGPFQRNPDQAWKLVEDYVGGMRLWSGIFEESVGNYAVFGVAQLKLSSHALSELSRDLAINTSSRRDNEGSLYAISIENAVHLVQTGVSYCHPIGSTEDSTEVRISDLHPTSLYRVCSVLACLDAF